MLLFATKNVAHRWLCNVIYVVPYIAYQLLQALYGVLKHCKAAKSYDALGDLIRPNTSYLW